MHCRSTTSGARSRHLGLTACAIILLVTTIAIPIWTSAASFRTDVDVTIPEVEIVEEDLFAAGDTFVLEGTSEHGVFAGARSVDIDGTVEGSLNVVGGATSISGVIAHSVRVIGGVVNVSGTVGGDLVVFGGSTTITNTATVEGDVQVYGGMLTVDGTVGDDAIGSVGVLEIDGDIGGDVRADVERLDLGDEADIAGELIYVSPGEGEIAPGAEVAGEIERLSVAPWGMESGAQARFFSPLVRTVWLLITGAFVIATAPRLATALNETLERPLPAIIAGLLALVGVPVLAILLLTTVVGIPLGLLLLVTYIVALYVSQVVVGLRIGAWLLPHHWADGSRGHLLLSMTIGVLLLSTLHIVPVPFIGSVVSSLVAVVGLGTAVLLFGRLRSRYIIDRV
ncbi:MAG: polymer-forming cytoskeletal protein [Chloroflexota bacterium]|nr:polymer-forming cytoskeletal protein [Chloroflexota bacterium]